MEQSNKEICLVCGYQFEEGEYFIDDNCPCCGVIQGYVQKSARVEYLNSLREYWIEKERAQWKESGMQPEGWNKEMALKQIKENVPSKFVDETPKNIKEAKGYFHS